LRRSVSKRSGSLFHAKEPGVVCWAATEISVVITRAGEKTVGILVDALVRQQEIVIKSIGERLKSTPGVAGATEIGESEIVLVIDVGTLIDQFGGRAREARSMAGV